MIYPYHRQRPGCCSEHRLARVHQGFVNDADRRFARPWTTNDTDADIAAALRSPLKWAQALAGFITVALVIVALITAAGGLDRLP